MGVNSKTSAGGVGFYISENINFTRRNYLDLALTEGVENCWIEIQRIKQKNVVIGCIYRQPSQNRETFHEAIETKLNLLTDENCIQERKYYRDFSKFNNELFIDDLNKIHFNNFVSTDVNQSMNGITNASKTH